jgi:hypothetical protein
LENNFFIQKEDHTIHPQVAQPFTRVKMKKKFYGVFLIALICITQAQITGFVVFLIYKEGFKTTLSQGLLNYLNVTFLFVSKLPENWYSNIGTEA